MEFEDVEVNSEKWLDIKDLLNEEWRDIKNYEGSYQVSNYGRVKSFKYKNERILKYATTSKNAYFFVILSNKNIKKPKTIHRLVAEAFLPNFNNLPMVNHIDCNKRNNKVNNLEWCTRNENILHAIKNKRMCSGKDNFKSRPVFVYDLNNNYIDRFDCIREAKKKLILGGSDETAHIVECCKGKINKAYGYKWRYADENTTS